MTKLVCIVCPRGCRLSVDEANDFAVSGHQCGRGLEYAQSETKNPRRLVTSTVRFASASHRRLPVRTSIPVAKGDVTAVMRALDGLTFSPPVRVGDVLVKNIAGSGADLVATRSLTGG